ncbi:MAG: ATP-binding protein [Tepidisphaeraceae bacterium]
MPIDPEPFLAPPVDPLDAVADVQRQIASLQEQLTESQRLATVGTIAAVIAHEFNNLLTPIVSYCQLALQSIEQEKDDSSLVQKALAKSLQHATRAGKICTSMLSLVRGEGEDQAVAVQELVEETLSVLARDPRKDGIALRVQVQPSLAVKGDPVQLEQVLLNLLINARQALLADSATGIRGKSITIKADRVESGEIRISVIDTGPGIAERNLARIFDPFFTTKTNPKRGEHRGSGLGLHICKQIIERHQGRISVESAPGRGTTFAILLPAA